MSNNSDCNVHGVEYREAKEPQGNPSSPVADLFRLDHRTIIVTGASGFLGTTLAIAILESGGDVVGLDIARESDSWSQVEKAAEKYSGKTLYYPIDITNEDAVTQVFSTFIPTLRYPVRGVVSCAGISLNGPSTEFPASSFRHMLDVNVTGSFLVAREAAKEMQKSNVSGSMVLVASMSGRVSNKGVDTAGYNSSKAAVQQLARSLAAEWGSRKGMPLVRVNTLSPGYIRTAATAGALKKPGMESQWVGDNMLFRLSTVDEFRAPVLYMLGDGSSFMTGADLAVDAGHTAW